MSILETTVSKSARDQSKPMLKGGRPGTAEEVESSPLILCIGHYVPLQTKTNPEKPGRYLIAYVPDVDSAARVLSKESIDLIMICAESSESNIAVLRQLRERCSIEQLPLVAFHAGGDDSEPERLFESGFIESFDANTSKALMAQKILRLVAFRKSCIRDARNVEVLKSYTETLNSKLETSEIKLEKLESSLQLEKIKRKELEQVNYTINKSLMTISAGNHALVEASTENELAQSMCDALVKHAKYVRAWVGFVKSDDNNKLDIIAHASSDNHPFPVALNCQESRFGCRSVAHSIISNITVINRNIPDKQSCEPCWDVTAISGYDSTVSLPLEVAGHAIGVLKVSTNAGIGIDHDEMEVLEEVAGDLAFGIDALRVRYERDVFYRELNSQNRRLEEEIEIRTKSLRAANEKLLELDTLKSLFIAAMSHELRTPLNSIIGFTGIILKGMSGDLTEKQIDQLGRVYGSAKHLLELIVNVIDIAKIDGHRIELFPQSFIVNDVVSEVIEELQAFADKKNLPIMVEMESEITMVSDLKRVMQCVRNLISNAIKYTETGHVRVSVVDDDDYVCIFVEDTGIGIAESELEDCFQAFERLPTHLKVKAGGAGLGLYLTRKLVVDLLGGLLDVESKLGEGSRFQIALPKQLAPQTLL